MGLDAMPKKYYAQRRGVKSEPLDFEMLKKAFLLVFEKLEAFLYFRQATGYKCVDQEEPISGVWGTDPETFFFINLRMHKLWPIRENINDYDELKLFTVIEFLYDYVSEPQTKYYHKWNDCGYHTSDYDAAKGKARYREEMNDILKDYKSGYELSESGLILERPSRGFEFIFQEIEKTGDSTNIEERINTAIVKFRRYNATLDEKKDSVRTLADVLEYMKKGGIKLPSKDDSDLFNIINNFDIRHHNRDQQGEYDKEIWYDWLFYTFLSSINVLLKLNKKS